MSAKKWWAIKVRYEGEVTANLDFAYKNHKGNSTTDRRKKCRKEKERICEFLNGRRMFLRSK